MPVLAVVSSKVARRTAGQRKRQQRMRKKRQTFFSLFPYIHEVLKLVKPATCIDHRDMDAMDGAVKRFFNAIAAEASSLARHNKRSTITSREIQTAVRRLLPGELAKLRQAVSQGHRAMAALLTCHVVTLMCQG